MRPSERIADLIFRYLRNELSAHQQEELETWRNASAENERFFQEETDLEKIRKDLKEAYDHKDAVWQKIVDRAPGVELAAPKTLNFRSYVAAAAILILLISGLFFFMQPAHRKQIMPVISDIAAGGEHATLILSNGRKILLDTVQNGLLANESESIISKKDSGSLNYKIDDPDRSGRSKEILYNTLITPRGGEFSVTLPDGTKVWLNASSTLRYPTVFSNNQRKVELTGEGYFEVSKSKVPFRVFVNHDATVEVLGTHFNIMAYGEEPYMATTLLEGSVRVARGSESKMIQPGEQAKVTGSSIDIIKIADTENAVAWMKGRTFFKDASVEAIMRMISRWYDVKVEYQGNIAPRNITGGISRNANLSELLNILRMNSVHFKVEDKTIIITP